MIEVGKNSKINIKWKVSPYDFSKEKVNEIIAKASNKYNISKSRITVSPIFKTVNDNGEKIELTNDIVSNIQDPNFQVKLFQDYLNINNIQDYDFDLIKKIDFNLNNKIDYQSFDKYRRFQIKWIKWDNFLSYGKDNYFDFSSLKGLVLLDGENQSGKTTFAIDLIHFLLFGKTDKVDLQSNIFNKHLPKENKVEVEGCINIDGEDFIIKRILTRPTYERRSSKSKVNQKVEYYKIVGQDKETLEDYVDLKQDENSAKTNKIIKEAIGREDDFDLAMSITETNLDDLIEKKDTERGRLLSRWIGLLPLETKDTLARAQYNQEVKPYLLSNQYNKETLKNEIEAYKVSSQSLADRNEVIKGYIASLDSEIEACEKDRAALLQSKDKVDETLLSFNIVTLKASIEDITQRGIRSKGILQDVDSKINAIGDVDFSVAEYDKKCALLNEYSIKKGSLSEKYNSINANILSLEKSEYCPTCGRKFENVDNSQKINELKQELSNVVNDGKDAATNIEALSKEIESMKNKRDLYNTKNNYIMQKSSIELDISRLRNDLTEKLLLQKNYENNSTAIEKNQQIDINIRNNDILLRDKRSAKNNHSMNIVENNATIKQYNEEIDKRNKVIGDITEEEKLIKNWKIYLELVGKNGITKMVLRKTLPIVNARLAQILSNVCDFDVEVVINEKNDVSFDLIKDGIRSDLSSGSGFERTCASLAIRFVLSDISTISRGSFCLMDEVWGRVSIENLDNIKKLIDNAVKGYNSIFIVAHVPNVKEWCTATVSVSKHNNISKIDSITVK